MFKLHYILLISNVLNYKEIEKQKWVITWLYGNAMCRMSIFSLFKFSCYELYLSVRFFRLPAETIM